MSESTGPANERAKEKINLPQTDFAMKANLPTREPEIIKIWEGQQIYQKLQKKNVGKKKFVMPDGPPYANGDLHMGHALNKCLKDFILKYKSMSGFEAPFIPGWDCHGLPIEHKVTKDLGPKRKEKTDKEIRELCRQEALKWVGRQRDQFKRLGIVADWENPYLTLQPAYEAEEVRELGRILKNGILYLGKKPVYWCWALQTALADAEIEYHEHRSPSIYVKFDMSDAAKKFATFKKPVSVLIWTTTPWTLPSNFGVALRPEFDYSFFDTENHGILFLAVELAEAVSKDTGIEMKEIGPRVKGQSLDRMEARHPFYERPSLFVLGTHVNLEGGTGAVHTAPGHGQDDYIVGQEYGLPVFSPVDDDGKYTDEVPEYKGVFVFDANPMVVERLKEKNALLSYKEFTHSYPHCWRSKTPVIYRATPQWFISMDDKNFNVRQKALQAIKNIQFVPDWGVKRLTSMVENRPDWCLTRQRNWGVPLPIFYCKNCGEAHFTEATSFRVADIMEKSGGIEGFFDNDVKALTGDIQCEKCQGKEFEKGRDILDVWFDSGVCFSAVQKKREGLGFPADMYLEGSDQHRGWFQTSLLASISSTGQAPFKSLLTHNFVNAADGRKMSKSLGNGVDPIDLTQKNGAEILRLWVASQDYGDDINFSQESYNRIMESYRRFRNTIRYLLGNLSDFKPGTHDVKIEQMLPIDRWALHELNQLTNIVTEHYERYEFFRVFQAFNNYFTTELSAYYLDVIKDRLYTFKTEGRERRSAQTVLWHLLDHLTRMLAPLASFLAEETYSHFPKKELESVLLTEFPQPIAAWENSDLALEFRQLLSVRAQVNKQLEEMRQNKVIGSSLEALVQIQAPPETLTLLKKYQTELREFFIVSEVKIGAESAELQILCQKALGEKCPRCWNYSAALQKNPQQQVCEKCLTALQ